ncbi:hypothetical protein Lesp02_23490 [Lentzea sp. NBRC 105346]|uniref:hypothetical protein n=1 Tax=Lentzea sp. NBRC 105346 TaxID=3032205 RepID=UPI0024A11196|nr:hypothetical protein [Lentzea sp. NBRC 105346]GLZ30159.1 hypothetical protein Lesp02_23490 [Lentzea sp. NBRC 105346]
MLAGRVRMVVAGVAVLVFAVVAPAYAEDPDDVDTTVTFMVNSGTETTFEVLSGPLSVSAPESVALGDSGPSSSITSTLGTVTVTDMRALMNPTWTAEVSSTDFTTGSGTAGETIPAEDVAYWSGPQTSFSGMNTITAPGQLNQSNRVPIHERKPAFALTSGRGNNSVSWNPTLVITIPDAAVAGEYTGTVTHSAA